MDCNQDTLYPMIKMDPYFDAYRDQNLKKVGAVTRTDNGDAMPKEHRYSTRRFFESRCSVFTAKSISHVLRKALVMTHV